MECTIRVQRNQSAELDEIFLSCASVRSMEDLVNEIFPQLVKWLEIDILALTMVDAPSVMVASQRNIDPILQQRICVHSADCIGMDSDIQGVRHCGLDLIWVGHTPACGTKRIDSGAPILWTGAIQSNGWLKGILTLYREEIIPLNSIQLDGLKQVCEAMRKTVARIESLRTPRSAPIQNGVDNHRVLVFRLEHAEFIERCCGPETVEVLRREAATFLRRDLPGIENLMSLGHERIIMTRVPGASPLTVDEIRSSMDRAGGLQTQSGVPILLTVEDTRCLEGDTLPVLSIPVKSYVEPKLEEAELTTMAG